MIRFRSHEVLLDEMVSYGAKANAASFVKPVLLPTSDQHVEFVMDNAMALGKHFAMQASYRSGLAREILAKDIFYKHCARLGVAYPRTWQGEYKQLAGRLSEIEFPCLIKPVLIHKVKSQMKGRKVWIARHDRELLDILHRIPAGAGSMLVQEIVPGPESDIALYCAHVDSEGESRQAFTGRKLRQFPPGFGSASLVQGAPDPELARVSQRLLAGLGYTGIAALEFKRNQRTGELVVIEMNPRTSLWFSLSEASGRSVVLSAYRELAGASDVLVETPQIDGIRWRDAPRDIASAAFYRIKRDFVLPPPDIRTVGSAVSRINAVFDMHDPQPAWREALLKLRKGFCRVFPSRRSRNLPDVRA
jgi:predicted ATP-grasp superfamily ATP-dependent carboligase